MLHVRIAQRQMNTTDKREKEYMNECVTMQSLILGSSYGSVRVCSLCFCIAVNFHSSSSSSTVLRPNSMLLFCGT